MSRQHILERLENREISVAQAETLLDALPTASPVLPWPSQLWDALKGVKWDIQIFNDVDYWHFLQEAGLNDDIDPIRPMLRDIHAIAKHDNIARIVGISDDAVEVGFLIKGASLCSPGIFGDKRQDVVIRFDLKLVSDVTKDEDFEIDDDDEFNNDEFDDVEGFYELYDEDEDEELG